MNSNVIKSADKPFYIFCIVKEDVTVILPVPSVCECWKLNNSRIFSQIIMSITGEVFGGYVPTILKKLAFMMVDENTPQTTRNCQGTWNKKPWKYSLLLAEMSLCSS